MHSVRWNEMGRSIALRVVRLPMLFERTPGYRKRVTLFSCPHCLKSFRR